jgi:acetyl-CoA/propionyl-CoA carboxylase carboxyl transferase subunit
MFVTGPKVVRAVTGEDINSEALGGGRVHAETSGVAHFLVKSEVKGIEVARQILSYFPPNNHEHPPMVDTDDPPSRLGDDLRQIVPEQCNKPYEIRDVIHSVLDRGSFLEVQTGWAQNIRVGLGRLAGAAVGVVANNPAVCAGVLDSDASRKAARFVRTCNAFGLPLLSLVDVPGFMPGSRQEHGGIIDHGAKLAFAYCEATVPKISVILRKAYGGAYIVMSSKHVGGDLNFAWPNAQIAVVGAAAAVEILHGKELKEVHDPAARRAKLAAEYHVNFANSSIAEARGFLDAVIEPAQTRRMLCQSLRAIRGKCEVLPYKRNGNIPL